MTVWAPIARAAIHSRSWPDDDSAVVYNELTGATHLLDALAFELLRMIVESPRSTIQLRSELTASLAEVTPSAADAAVEAALARLRDNALIASRTA